LVEYYEDPQEIEHEKFQEAARKLEEHWTLIQNSVKEIPWAKLNRASFLSKMPLGIISAHYPPSKEAGSFTNVALKIMRPYPTTRETNHQ
jgi:hypothetical protein